MAWWNKKSGTKINPNFKGGNKKVCKCVICGVEFIQRKDFVKKYGAKYCSHSCANKARDNSGNKNPNWKGGITEVHFLIRASKKYKEWRTKVFKRDLFKCTKCGYVGTKIEAHHIVRFSILLGYAIELLPLLNVYDSAMAYSPLWEVENGNTLCENCHKKEHKKPETPNA